MQKEDMLVNSNLSGISCVVFINIVIFIIHSSFILYNVKQAIFVFMYSCLLGCRSHVLTVGGVLDNLICESVTCTEVSFGGFSLLPVSSR